MIEHIYTNVVTKGPTCAEKGITTFTCTACNHSYTEEIKMVAHTWGEATVTKEPTCIAEGEKTATCTVCGTTEVSEKIATVEHTYQTKVKVTATCIEKGVNTLTCSVCNNSKEESSKALGHNYQQSNVITKCTCTSDGEVTMTCSRCQDSYNETQKATGHNWLEANCLEARQCKNCKLTEGDALGHNDVNGKCSRCGKSSSTAKMADNFPLTYRVLNYECDLTITEGSASISTYSDGSISITVKLTAYITNHDGSGALNDHSFRMVVYDSNGNAVSYKYCMFEGYAGESMTNRWTFSGLPKGDYTVDLFKA